MMPWCAQPSASASAATHLRRFPDAISCRNARNCLLAADMGDMAANLRADLEAEEAQLGALREELAALVAQRAAKQAEMAAATQRWNQAKMLKVRGAKGDDICCWQRVALHGGVCCLRGRV